MCAILGAAGPIDKELMKRLWNESSVRGRHAYGCFYLEENGAPYFHKSVYLEQIRILVPEQGPYIGHCRYATSGDYREARNNQPLLADRRALVFNGVISMLDRAGMEARYSVTLPGENDGYLLLRWLEAGVLPSDWPKGITYAAAWLEGTPDASTGLLLRVRRNEGRPAWTCEYNGGVYLASTRDIFRRAGLTGAEMIPPNETITL